MEKHNLEGEREGKMKLCFADVETTGVDHKRNGIIQLAGSICNLDDDNKLIELSSFNYKLKPMPNDIIEDRALQVNGITREQLMKFTDSRVVYSYFTGILSEHCDKYDKEDKLFFAGYNSRFDYDFMRSWFEKCGDNYFGSFFFFPPLDVMNIAIFHLMQERHILSNFKLETVANHLGIRTNGNLHDAMVDIEITKKIFVKYLKTENLPTPEDYEPKGGGE